MFSWRALKGLFCFGWKLTISALLDVGYGNLYGLIIGRFYSRADLAFVNKGRAVPQLAMDAINGTLGRVAFPALAQVQDKRDVVRETMRRMIATSTFFVFPLMTGCAVCAEDIVSLLFGDQWGMAVPYVRIACFTFALWPFHTINLQAINALGRSDLFLILEIIKKGLGLTLLIFSIPYGVWWMMALGAFVMGPMSVMINAWPNRKLLGYTIGMQLRDIFPAVLLCALMTGFILPLVWLPLPIWGRLLLQIPLGILIYVFSAWLFRLAPLCEMARLLSPIMASRLPKRMLPLAHLLFNRLK
jgi:O-antigen/teichoic acid export membrane protein